MLPEVGATELLLIAIVALIVVGPKDLPFMLRKLGQFMAKLRGMASEFRASFDEMARQSELDDLRREVEAMRSGRFAEAAAGAGQADMGQVFRDIDEGLAGGAIQMPPRMDYGYGDLDGMPPEPAPAFYAQPIRHQSRPLQPGVRPQPRSAPRMTSPRAKAAAKRPPSRPRPRTGGGRT